MAGDLFRALADLKKEEALKLARESQAKWKPNCRAHAS